MKFFGIAILILCAVSSSAQKQKIDQATKSQSPKFNVEHIGENFKKDFLLKGDGTGVLKAGRLERDTFNKKAIFENTNFEFFEITDCRFEDELSFNTLNENNFQTLYLNNCVFLNGLDFSTCNIQTLLSISGKIDGELDLTNLKASNSLARIDLTELKPVDSKSKILINLTDAPIANIEMDFDKFKLVPASIESEKDGTKIYNGLLANYKARGVLSTYKAVDIEFHKYLYAKQGYFGSLINFLQCCWWNYGYDKQRVIYYTLIGLIIFTLINLLLYKKLNRDVYIVNVEFDTQPASFYNSLVYTSVVFFSFTLDLGKLKFGRKGYLTWFLIIYVFGLICLAY